MSKKKRVFHESDKVVCCTNRFVLDWGYEHTFNDCLLEMAKEANVKVPKPYHSDSVEWRIFREHPLFKACQRSFEEFSADLSKVFKNCFVNWGEVDFFRCSAINPAKESAIKFVRECVYQRLRNKMLTGNERKLFFGEILEAPTYFVVMEKKVVQTGKYYPSETWGGGGMEPNYECTPGGLTDRKTHVLLWVQAPEGVSTKPLLSIDCLDPIRCAKRYREGSMLRGCYLLASDCITLEEAKVAERLHGKPLEWGKSDEYEHDIGGHTSKQGSVSA